MVNRRHNDATYLGLDDLIHYGNAAFAWCSAYARDMRRRDEKVITCLFCAATRLLRDD